MNSKLITILLYFALARCELTPVNDTIIRTGLMRKEDLKQNGVPTTGKTILVSKGKYVYLIMGELNNVTVGYPAVLINERTLASFLVEELSNVVICDNEMCTLPEEVSTHANYTFWTLKLGINKRRIEFFNGDITTTKCFLNRNLQPTKFTILDKFSQKYKCDDDCKEHDVIICDEKIAGVLEGVNNSRGTVIFHGIKDILDVGGYTVKNSKIGAVLSKKRRKPLVMKVRVTHKGRNYFNPVALINPNTAVSYHMNFTDLAEICRNLVCTKVDRAETHGEYTFWTDNDTLSNVPEFYRGNITAAACSLNREYRRNNFKLTRHDLPEYACNGDCASNDIVICDGRIAGILQKTNNGLFQFHNIRNILGYINVEFNDIDNDIVDIEDLIVDFKINVSKEMRIPGVFIQANTAVTFKVDNATSDTTLICPHEQECFQPHLVFSKGDYSFWRFHSTLTEIPKPKFFTGDITQAGCTLNRQQKLTKFKQIMAEKQEYTCSVRCSDGDVVVCGGKTAGIITKTTSNDSFSFHHIDNILSVGGYRSDRSLGAVKRDKDQTPATPKHFESDQETTKGIKWPGAAFFEDNDDSIDVYEELNEGGSGQDASSTSVDYLDTSVTRENRKQNRDPVSSEPQLKETESHQAARKSKPQNLTRTIQSAARLKDKHKQSRKEESKKHPSGEKLETHHGRSHQNMISMEPSKVTSNIQLKEEVIKSGAETTDYNHGIGIVRILNENGTTSKYPAVLIKPNFVVSLQIHDTDEVNVCFGETCTIPTGFHPVKQYNFWKLRHKNRHVPEFFQGSIDTANCTRYGEPRFVKFVPVTDDIYVCEPNCSVSDIILCDDKLAGLITSVKMSNVGYFSKITDILKLANEIPGDVQSSVYPVVVSSDGKVHRADSQLEETTAYKMDAVILIKRNSTGTVIVPCIAASLSGVFIHIVSLII